ncbi:MAG: hypothetical protein Q6M04_03645 [Thermostichus sp. BF3_bins_97]
MLNPSTAMITRIPPSHLLSTIRWDPLPADFILPDQPMDPTQQPPLADGLTDALL